MSAPSPRLLVACAAVAVAAAAAGCPSEIAAPGCRGANCQKDEEEQAPPRLFVDPPFGLGFDCVSLGCDVERRMVVENRGGGTISLVLARLDVGSSTDFTLRTGTGEPLPFDANSAVEVSADTPLELLVRYTPSDGTADDGAVLLDWHDATIEFDDAVLERVELPLSTRALGDAEVTVVERRLNFGFVPVGGYATREIVIDNTGAGGVLEAGPVALAEGTPDVFLEPTDGAWAAAFANPGDSVTFAVNFRPTEVGTFTGQLEVRTSDGANPTVTIDVVGTAIAEPVVSVTASGAGVARVDFQAIRVGTTRTLPVRFDNGGGAPLTVRPTVQLGAGLTLSSNAEITIAPLESATVDLTWSPSTGGQFIGRLEVQTNDPARRSFFIDVSGFANAPRLAATPTTLNFGSVVQGWTTDGRSFELSNDGFGELTISSIAFEVGSSSQIRFAEVPDLPVKLSPGDTPVRVTLVMEASTLGSQSATVLVGTDGVDGPLGQDGVGRVSVRGLVVDCESGCPMQNATPSCAVNNECRIDRCDDRFHNADLSVGNGCECGEDLIPAAAGARRDVPGVCGGQSLGDLGDECSSRPSEARFTGTIHGRDDVDLFFYRAFDDSSFPTCDVTSDSFRASVRIEGAPAGLRVCARGAQNAGCGGENQRTCGGTALTVKDGSFGNDDDRDVTVWVEWTPGQEQDICASYTLVARARK